MPVPDSYSTRNAAAVGVASNTSRAGQAGQVPPGAAWFGVFRACRRWSGMPPGRYRDQLARRALAA